MCYLQNSLEMKAAFNERFDDARNKPMLDWISPAMNTVPYHQEVKRLLRGEVLKGESLQGNKFIAINTLDGAMVVYISETGGLSYYCDSGLASLQSMQMAGFKLYGDIENLAQLKHFFAIPDSYRF